MEATLSILVVVGLLMLKVLLIRAVWRMAGEQGRSRVLPVTVAVVFSALIVFLALYLSGRERKLTPPGQGASEDQ